MTEQPESGELLVGSYLRLVEECELVMYNQRSQTQGDQLEIDVIGVDSTEEGERVVYTCEVVTHIDGLHYSGTPDTDRWDEYGNDDYQYTLELLWRKFNSDREYVTELFDADDYSFVFQFWSPVVRGNRDEKYLLTGLYDMADEFKDETGTELELIINEEYTERIKALREKAEQTKDYGELGFRILQILEHLR